MSKIRSLLRLIEEATNYQSLIDYIQALFSGNDLGKEKEAKPGSSPRSR